MSRLLPSSAESSELGFRTLQSIRQIIRRVTAHSRAVASETGLTLPQMLCLRAIRDLEIDEVTLAAVAEAVQLTPSTTSGIVDRLVKAGLVDRARSERDRRRIHLTLTDEGQARLADMPRPLQEAFLDRLAALPREQQEQLLSSLDTLVELMDASELSAAPMLVDGHDVSDP